MPPKARPAPSAPKPKNSGANTAAQTSAPSRSASLLPGSASAAPTVAPAAKAIPERAKSRYAFLDDSNDLFTPVTAPAPQAAPVSSAQPAASGSRSGVSVVAGGEVSTTSILCSFIDSLNIADIQKHHVVRS